MTKANRELRAALGKKRGKTEAELALEIRTYLEVRGWRVHRLSADRFKGRGHKKHEYVEPGTPDYICVAPDRFFYWEAKREKGGKVRPTQRAWIDEARDAGIRVLEAPRSVLDACNWLNEWTTDAA